MSDLDELERVRAERDSYAIGLAALARDAKVIGRIRDALDGIRPREILELCGTLCTERGDFYVVKDVRLIHALVAIAEHLGDERAK